MISNKETGWKRTEEMNKGGPKTKAEIETEVQEKFNKEVAERGRGDGGQRGGKYQGDRYDNRDNRRDNRDNRRDNRDGKNYNK